MKKNRCFMFVLAVVVALGVIGSLFSPVLASPPWFGQGCNTSYIGPNNLRAGGYSPQSLTQEQRQWLFEVFGNAGEASVGYGGTGCPWQNQNQSAPSSPSQPAWFGQGCGTSAVGPNNLRAGGYSPQTLTQEQRQWLFEVFGNAGEASVGYGGTGCDWQNQNQSSPSSPSQPSWFGQGCSTSYTGPNNLRAGGYSPQALTQEQRQWLFEVFGNAGEASVGYGGTGCDWQKTEGSSGSSSNGSTGSQSNTNTSPDGNCDGALSSSVSVGIAARITYTDGTSSRLRTGPSRQDSVITLMPEGEEFSITDGPVCNQSLRWWEISSSRYGSGWVADSGNGSYWIEPVPQAAPTSVPVKQPTVTTAPVIIPTEQSVQPEVTYQYSCYTGSSFDIVDDGKEKHHIVIFNVDSNIPAIAWDVTGPYRPSAWPYHKNSGKVEAGFRWVDFLPVLFVTPSDFTACPKF